MPRIILLLLCLAQRLLLLAQGPNDTGTYYQSADGLTGAELKTALAQIVLPHEVLSYKDLWSAFYTTDVRPDGRVWDMYSDMTDYTFGTDQAGNFSKEGDKYNREHSFPKSWFGGAVSPMYTDLMHLVPTDGYVNGKRSNFPFGETAGESYKSHGAFSKLGRSTTPGYTGTVFEPADEYKGDFARIYFYMVTAYEDRLEDWHCDMLDGQAYPGLSAWALPMLLRWAEQDPVSEKETRRNDAVGALQHNRNPYVDYPGLEQYVWGTLSEQPFSYDHYQSAGLDRRPATSLQSDNSAVYDLQGRRIYIPFGELPHGVYIVGGHKIMSR